VPQLIPTDPDKDYERWFFSYWRPACAWQYLFVCLFDFMIAPIMMAFYSVYTGEYHGWDPLTIRGGGLYHLAMGAVVGVAVWSRGREKMALMDNFSTALNSNGGPNDPPPGDDSAPRMNDRAAG